MSREEEEGGRFQGVASSITLFEDALATGTFELIDDPAAAYRLSGNVFQKWNSRPQLHVVFNSIPQNKALENEVLYIFNATEKFQAVQLPNNSAYDLNDLLLTA